MALPANVGTGTVIGKFIDSAGANLDGTVTFTPSVAKLLDVTATPPTTIVPKPVTATVTAGAMSQVLMATNDADLNPTNWTYQVSFALTGATVAPFSIAVPQGTTVDLTVVSPVASAPGVAQVVGPGVPPGGADTFVLAKASAVDYDTEWVAQTGGGGGGGTLDSLTDVVNSAPASGHILRYNGTNYVNVLGSTFFQSASAELAALAALTGTAYGRAFLTLSNQAGLMALVQAASESVAGKAQFATNGQTVTGTSTTLATHPAGVASALATRAPTANPVFTGTVTVPDAVFTIAKTSGLQGQLDAKLGGGVTIGISELPPWSTIYNFYNTGTSSYPNRPTSRTDIVVVWRGTLAVGPPSVGGTGALAGVDEYHGF